ncbi:MAG: 4Fe-4S dicluster domain-containing protein, partial [Ahrensia sp.]
ARAITEGGWQSVPKVSFPGGALIGCSAGFVNVPRIKGSHNAVLSGILAAEKAAAAIAAGQANDNAMDAYENEWRDGAIGKDLKRVRNVKPLWSKFGTRIGVAIGGIDMWINQITGGWSPLGTLSHGKPDHASVEPASKHKPINYPKPDGEVSFDRLSSVFLSSTNHEEDQPIHLKVQNQDLQKSSEYADFAGLSHRYCPAGVYEWVDSAGNTVTAPHDYKASDDVRFQINAQNCVHCKTCDIKDPNQNINWTVPQGGEGPVYPNM